MSRTFIARVSLVVILATGGGLALETAAASAAAPARHAAKPPKKTKPVTIKLATTPLGKVIVTTKGFTLYAFDPDGTDTVSPEVHQPVRHRLAGLRRHQEDEGRGQGSQEREARDRWRRPGRLQRPLPLPLQR